MHRPVWYTMRFDSSTGPRANRAMEDVVVRIEYTKQPDGSLQADVSAAQRPLRIIVDPFGRWKILDRSYNDHPAIFAEHAKSVHAARLKVCDLIKKCWGPNGKYICQGRNSSNGSQCAVSAEYFMFMQSGQKYLCWGHAPAYDPLRMSRLWS